jgi:hypothetical protein
MTRLSLIASALVLFVITAARPASAVPVLQLDIANGTYDPVTQTVLSADNPFTLYALLTPKSTLSATELTELLSATYYLAIAIVPQIDQDADLGSFTLNGATYNVTSDMVYGTPPYEVLPDLQGHDGGDLGSHGIYDTFFLEVPLTFAAAPTATTYNVENNPGGLVPSATGGTYYASFSLDTLNLDPDYVLHFDLYNTDIRECAAKKKAGGPQALCPDVDVDDFAPFSHDAQSTPPDRELPPPVPEPTTMLLLGSALSAGGSLRWYRRRQEGKKADSCSL